MSKRNQNHNHKHINTRKHSSYIHVQLFYIKTLQMY